MENKNNVTIYVYRYMWLVDGSEKLNIKVVSGTVEEHELFINALKNEQSIVNACRVYLHEIDINLIEMYDSIVNKEKKDGE